MCCVALFLRPTASLAQINPGMFTITSPTNFIRIGAWGGGFTYCAANAFDSLHPPSVHSSDPNLPVAYPGNVYSGVAETFGDHWPVVEAWATGSAQIGINPNAQGGVFWSGTFNTYAPPTGPWTFESMTTWGGVKDPVTANVNPGDPITVSFTPTSALGMVFPDDPNAVYSSTFSAFAQTDLPGLASLYSLSIQMSSAKPGDVVVSFTSNPLLGLNDAAIISELVRGFQYNSTTGDYSFDPTGEAISATFTVPASVSSLIVTTGMDSEQNASVGVPEPSTMIAGALLLLPVRVSTLRMLRKTRTA